MHKKLEADLISLAHAILQMKNRDDVVALKEKAQYIYEKLSVLAHVEDYINTTPNSIETKEELVAKVEESYQIKEETSATVENISATIEAPAKEDQVVIEDKIIEEVITEETKEAKIEETIEQPFEDIENLFFPKEPETKNDVKDIGETKTTSLDEELKDTIPLDVVADLFENAVPKSLNDALKSNIQIGLNDRIIFVKNLFNGSQEDYNRVVSQLNTFKTETEAKKFINKMVKPDYNWSEHEDLEARFMEIVQRKYN